MHWRRWLLKLAVGLVAFGVIRFLIAGSPRPENLGLQDGTLAPCPPKPNCWCSDDPDPGHQIEPLRFTGPPAEAWQRLQAAVNQLPRTTIITRTDDYLHAESRTLIMGYIDDVEARLDAEAGVIQIRSASRIGYSDMGANAARLAALRQAFEPR